MPGRNVERFNAGSLTSPLHYQNISAVVHLFLYSDFYRLNHSYDSSASFYLLNVSVRKISRYVNLIASPNSTLTQSLILNPNFLNPRRNHYRCHYPILMMNRLKAFLYIDRKNVTLSMMKVDKLWNIPLSSFPRRFAILLFRSLLLPILENFVRSSTPL